MNLKIMDFLQCHKVKMCLIVWLPSVALVATKHMDGTSLAAIAASIVTMYTYTHLKAQQTPNLPERGTP
jgi:hypothetical protein